MARITDKADLNDGTEYTISLGAKTLALAVAGNLSAGSANGVVGQALFSALHDLWKSGATHNRYEFPFFMVDGPIATMLELRDGWEMADSTSLTLLRGCGLAYKNTSGTVTAEWACFEQLGTLADNAHQPYHRLGTATTPTDFGVADEFNELVQVYGDASHGNLDIRSTSNAKFYVREAGFTYGYYDLSAEQNLTTLEPRRYQIPMTTTADAAVSVTGPSGAPYSGMTLTLGATTHTINGVSYNFAEGEIDANGGTLQQTYDWYQNLLLSTGDIDSGAGTQRGDIYTGASLTLAGGILTTSQGLVVKNTEASAVSSIVQTDDTGTGRQQAVTATGEVTGMPTTGANIRLQVYNTTAAASSAWAGTTAYSEGDRILRSTGAGLESTAGLYFQCSTAGTSGSSEPTWDTTPGNTTNDGTVVWTCYALLSHDADPGSASYSVSYTDGIDYQSGDSLRVRFAELDAGNTFSIFAQNVIVSSTGWSVACDEEADASYATNGVDGSGVTKFTATFTGTPEINLTVAQNWTGPELWAFYCYQLTVSNGMHYFWGGATSPDAGNYRVNASVLDLKLDNETTATQRQTDSSRVYRDDGVYPVKDPTTSGYGIDVNWKNVVYVVTAGSGLDAAQQAQLSTAASQATTAATQATDAATDTDTLITAVAAIPTDAASASDVAGIAVDSSLTLATAIKRILASSPAAKRTVSGNQVVFRNQADDADVIDHTTDNDGTTTSLTVS